MPVWTDPSTHIFANAEQVTATTLDTYVQQNIASMGNYAAATRYFFMAGPGGTATSKTAFGGAQSAIATFPEAFTMIVKVFGELYPTVATTTIVVGVWDETGSADISYGGAPSPWTFNLVPASAVVSACWLGKKQYAANGSAGFSLWYYVDNIAHTTGIWATVEVTFVRGAV